MPVLTMLRVPEVLSLFVGRRRNQLVAAMMALLACMTLLLAFGSAPEAIWFPPPEGHPGFSPVDAAPVQLLWPTVGVSVGPGAFSRNAIRRGLEALGLDGGIGPLGVAGIALALVAFGVARRLGCTTLSALATALALSFSGLFWTHSAAAEPATFSALFSLVAVGGLLLSRESKGPGPIVVAAACYAVAVGLHPSALGALPALIWAAPAGGLLPVAALGLAASLGGAWFLRTIGGVSSLGDWFVPQGLASAADILGRLPGELMNDFGVLGAVFLILGIVSLASRVDRLVLLGGWAAGVVAWTLVWAPPDGRSALIPMFVPLWLVAGVGMTWVQQLARTRTSRAGVVGLVALLPVLNLVAHFDTGARMRSLSDFTDRYLGELVLVMPDDTAVLAESLLLDRRMAGRQYAGGPLVFPRLPQTQAGALQALDGGSSVLGFAQAQANLQELGFRFEALTDAGVRMSVDELLSTVPDDWIVAVATGPQFTLSVLEDGPTFGRVGGTEPLFGRSRWQYGLVGVKGGPHRALELGGYQTVDFGVQAGDALTPDVRAPVAIRVLSSEEGGAIHYRGREVASTSTGIAMALVSPTGDLEAAFDVEYSRDLRIRVNPGHLAPALIDGREPCVEVPAGLWTDVSTVAGLSSLGGLIVPGRGLTVYVASEHPLVPRQVPLSRPTAPDLSVMAFDTQSASGIAALERSLEDDRVGDVAAQFLEASHVYRLRVWAPRKSQEQLALRFGGFATLALARPDDESLTRAEIEADAEPVPLVLCSAMRAIPGHPLIGATGEPAVFDVDLDYSDLFVFGWDRPEQAGAARFRWTIVPRAELLVPLGQPGMVTLAIEAQPAAGAATSLELRVNGAAFTPVVLEATPREYRWDVPAERWRAGMNQVSLAVSRLARPSDSGLSPDERLLGLAVRRIRLITDGEAGRR